MSKPDQPQSQAAESARPARPPHRPLLRQATTVADPLGGDASITVHLLVLGEEDAAEDHPDLREAGWISHMCNNMSVYVRIVW
jgi:hypothetical protein